MRSILNTYSTTELKKFISQSNIKKYSKLKKDELINLMVKTENVNKFKHIKPKEKKERKKPAPKPKTTLKKKVEAPKKKVEAPKKKPDLDEKQRILRQKIKDAGGKEAYLRNLGKKTKGRVGGKVRRLAEFKPKMKEAPKNKERIVDCFKPHKNELIIKDNNRKYVVCKKLQDNRVRLVEITGMKNNGVNKFGYYEGEPMEFSFSSLKDLLKFSDKTIKKIQEHTGIKEEKEKKFVIPKKKETKLTKLGEKIRAIFKSVPRTKDNDKDNENKAKKLRDKLDYKTRKELIKTYNKQGLNDNEEFIFDLILDDEYLKEIFLTKKRNRR